MNIKINENKISANRTGIELPMKLEREALEKLKLGPSPPKKEKLKLKRKKTLAISQVNVVRITILLEDALEKENLVP